MYADICNFLIASTFTPGASNVERQTWMQSQLVLHFCHSIAGGGHYGSGQTTRKVFDYGLYWPIIFQDTHEFVLPCEQCQKVRMEISRRKKYPNSRCYFVKFFMFGVFISWGHSLSPRETLIFYLLLIRFRDGWKLRPPKLMKLKFGVPKVLISDQGSHFYNRTMATILEKYRVVHKVATTYHPQTNGQAEVFNREIKKLLQKMANPNRNDWSRLLEDALWAHRIAYQTLLGMFPYHIELEELRLEAYENSRIYKEKLIASKLRSGWDGPFVVTNIFPYDVVELRDEANNRHFKVNGRQIKSYYEGPNPNPIRDEVEIILLMESVIPEDIP
ncbi:pol, partial [Mucuna pruriens]